MEIGTIGIWRRHQDGLDAVEEIEDLGFGALWLGGSPSLTQVRPFLERTTTLPVATGILNVWQHEPGDGPGKPAGARARFPGPFGPGLGLGHPGGTGRLGKAAG